MAPFLRQVRHAHKEASRVCTCLVPVSDECREMDVNTMHSFDRGLGEGLGINYFRKEESHLPTAKIGDIIRMHRAEVCCES